MEQTVVYIVCTPTYRELNFSARDNTKSIEHKWATSLFILRINRELVNPVIKAEF